MVNIPLNNVSFFSTGKERKEGAYPLLKKPSYGIKNRINLKKTYNIPAALPCAPEELKKKITDEMNALVSDINKLLPKIHAKIYDYVAHDLTDSNKHLTQILTRIEKSYDSEIEKSDYKTPDLHYYNHIESLKRINENTIEAIDAYRKRPTVITNFYSLNQQLSAVAEGHKNTRPEQLLHIASIEYIPTDLANSEFVKKTLKPLNKRILKYAKNIDAICNHSSHLAHKFLKVRIKPGSAVLKSYFGDLDKDLDDALTEFHNETIALASIDYLRDIYVLPKNLEELQKNEALQNNTVLNALNSLLMSENHQASAQEQVLHNINSGQEYCTSQPILIVKNLDNLQDRDIIAPNESTTSFKFDFNFAVKSIPLNNAKDSEITILIPVFTLDAKALDVLRNIKLPPEKIQAWAENFMKMAQVSDHDLTLHQMVIPHQENSRHYFIDKKTEFNNTTSKKFVDSIKDEFANPTIAEPFAIGLHLEGHALASHAQALYASYNAEPQRKTYVLKLAAESYQQLYEMQQIALSHCLPGKEANINEAITYFAEIYAHRLFRCISPTDKDLTEKKITIKTADGIKETTVAEEMEKLNLITPDRLQPAAKTKLETLIKHCSDWLGDTYKIIHDKNTQFPVLESKQIVSEQHEKFYNYRKQYFHDEDYKNPYAEIEINNISNKFAIDIIADYKEASAISSGNPEAFKWRTKVRTELLKHAAEAEEKGGKEASKEINQWLRNAESKDLLKVKITPKHIKLPRLTKVQASEIGKIPATKIER